MSDKKDTDRRTLIAAATAVAGVAAAGSAAAFNPQPDPPGRAATQIKVDLGGVHLSEQASKALEQQISRDVLAALARAGVKGAPHVGGLGPGIYGIIYRPVFLPGGVTQPGAVRDPTRQ